MSVTEEVTHMTTQADMLHYLSYNKEYLTPAQLHIFNTEWDNYYSGLPVNNEALTLLYKEIDR